MGLIDNLDSLNTSSNSQSLTGGGKKKTSSKSKTSKTPKSSKASKSPKTTKSSKPKVSKPKVSKPKTCKTSKPSNKNRYIIKYVVGKDGMVYQMKKKVMGGNSSPMDITNQNDDMFILSKETFNKSITAPINSPYDSLMSKNGNYNYNMIENKGFVTNTPKINLETVEKKPVVATSTDIVNSVSTSNNTEPVKGGSKKSKNSKSKSKTALNKYKSKYTDECVKKNKVKGGSDMINYKCPSTNYEKQFLELDTQFCNSAKAAYDKLNKNDMTGGKKKKPTTKKGAYKNRLAKMTVKQLIKNAKNKGIKVTKKSNKKTKPIKKATLIGKLAKAKK